MMLIGNQFHAPMGFRGLDSKQTYYFAGRYGSRVLIIWFARHAPKRRADGAGKPEPRMWRVFSIHMALSDFIAGLTADPPLIRQVELQASLPPWLAGEEGVVFSDSTKKISGQEINPIRAKVEGRFERIAPAVEEKEQILASPNPLSAVSMVCQKAGVTEHPHRLQLWFFAYLLHPGAGIWALKKPKGKTGRWDRGDDKHRNTKYGRKSLSAPEGGFSTALTRDAILKAYSDFCEYRKSMREIYDEAMKKVFGCVAVAQNSGAIEYTHPDDRPFPTYGQFRYVVVEEYGLSAVQARKYGDARTRNDRPYDEGVPSGQFANLFEDVQLDAYYTDDRPTAFHAGHPMPPLSVVRLKCSVSSAIAGIGFSLGAEREEAYRAALFCAAVPKSLVARLYGLNEDHLCWAMEGVPPACLTDRGPGSARCEDTSLADRFPLKAIAPSYDPKSKASVEASNPKSVRKEGAPTFRQSDLSIGQMMKREILRAIAQNHQTNISDRLTPAEVMEFNRRGWTATPQNLWNFRTEQMRTLARAISVEDAVRRFLTPQTITVSRVGVNFRTHEYSSPQFTQALAEGVLVAGHGITAYCVSMVPSIIWVEAGGTLLPLTPLMRTRSNGAEFVFSVSQAESILLAKAELDSRTRASADAARGKAIADFEQSTGKSWEAGRTRFGSPKRPAGVVKEEAKIADARPLRRRRGVA